MALALEGRAFLEKIPAEIEAFHQEGRRPRIKVDAVVWNLSGMDDLKSKILETQIWCQFCIDREARSRLRRGELRPIRHLWEGFKDHSYELPEFRELFRRKIAEVKAIAEDVRRKRADSIVSLHLSDNRRGEYRGQLIRYLPFRSTGDQLSHIKSQGLFDEFDEPGWDSLADFVKGDEGTVYSMKDWGGAEQPDSLVCWIPERFVALANEGIA